MRIRIEIDTVAGDFWRWFWSLNPVVNYFAALAAVVLCGAILVGAINLVQYFAP